MNANMIKNDNVDRIIKIFAEFIELIGDDDAVNKFAKPNIQNKLRIELTSVVSPTGVLKKAVVSRPRDPNAPRAKSALQLFYADAKIKGISGPKKIWESMSPGQKAVWEQKAAESKAQANIERETYESPNGKKKYVQKIKTARDFYITDEGNKARIRTTRAAEKPTAKQVENFLKDEFTALVASGHESLACWNDKAYAYAQTIKTFEDNIRNSMSPPQERKVEVPSTITRTSPVVMKKPKIELPKPIVSTKTIKPLKDDSEDDLDVEEIDFES